MAGRCQASLIWSSLPAARSYSCMAVSGTGTPADSGVLFPRRGRVYGKRNWKATPHATDGLGRGCGARAGACLSCGNASCRMLTSSRHGFDASLPNAFTADAFQCRPTLAPWNNPLTTYDCPLAILFLPYRPFLCANSWPVRHMTVAIMPPCRITVLCTRTTHPP